MGHTKKQLPKKITKKKPTLNLLIEKKIELLPRSLKLRLCSSRLKKSLTSVKSIPLNIHDLEKCIYLDMTYIFMSSGIFSKTITTHTTTKYFSIHEKKKLKKHRSVIAHILYPCTTFCLTNQT